MLFPTRPIRSAFGVILLLWSYVVLVVAAPCASSSVLETECNSVRFGLNKVILVAPLSDRFLLLTDNRFLFELSLESWHSDKNKLHLNNGTVLEDSATWSYLAGVVSNAVDNNKLIVSLLDGSSEYVWASPLNGPSVVCKIGDSKCSQASIRSVPPSGGAISSSEALTFYTLNQNHLSKCSLSSAVWRVPKAMSTSTCSTPAQHLGTTQSEDQIQVSDVECEANPIKWDIKTGFTDGDRFHLFTKENVYILSIPTGSETVTLTTVSLGDFFECNQECNKSRKAATICAALILTILVVFGVGLCVYYKRKQRKQAADRLCGNSSQPTGGNVISLNKQNNSKLKGSRGTRFSSTKGRASFGKVHTRKLSSGIPGTKVHSTRRVPTTIPKVSSIPRSKVKVSSIPRRNTSRKKANRTSSLKANKVSTNSRIKPNSKASKLMTKQKEIEKLELSKRIKMACTLGFD